MKGFPFDKDEENAEELAAAVQAAKDAEVAVIFAGLPDMMEAEGYDRKDMKLPACQNKLIEEVIKVQPNTLLCCTMEVRLKYLGQIKQQLFWKCILAVRAWEKQQINFFMEK